MPLAIRGLDLRISLSFHLVIFPPRIFASVVCLSWMEEPNERFVLEFFKLMGNVTAPPMLGMYSQPNVGSPDEYLLSVCA